MESARSRKTEFKRCCVVSAVTVSCCLDARRVQELYASRDRG